MRREGYEFQLSRPQVIYKTIDGKHEPFEEVTIEVQEEAMGPVIESMGFRKGVMQHMDQDQGLVNWFSLPYRGLLGYQSEFMTQSKGLGNLYNIFRLSSIC